MSTKDANHRKPKASSANNGRAKPTTNGHHAMHAVASSPPKPETKTSKRVRKGGEGKRGRGRSHGSRRLRCREAVARIRSLGGLARSPEVRRELAGLARSLERARMREPSVADAEARLDSLIATAAADSAATDRFIVCEAAAWAIAWLARSKHGGNESGALLQKLVRVAESCSDRLMAGRTESAAFVFVIGRLFDDIEACRELGETAASAIEREVLALSPPGQPIARSGSEAIVAKVAEWSRLLERSSQLSRDGGAMEPPWNENAHEGFVAAVEVAVRLLGESGRAVGPGGFAPASQSRPILEAARRVGPKPLARTARRLVEGTDGSHGLARDLVAGKARFAILRTGWTKRDVRVLVDGRSPAMEFEIAVGDRMLFAGGWEWSATADGSPLEAEGPWQESCHESDDNASFLEWTLPLSRGLRLERQIAVVPGDRVAVVSDSIVPRDDASRPAAAGSAAVAMAIEYRGSWTVCDGIGLEQGEETREVFGIDTAMRLMALPLALPEWSAAGGQGRFEAKGRTLTLSQSSAVARLHAPLWLDFEPRRIGGPLTWRQLSVADTRQNLPAHRACGYRVQAGRRQWLVYRALDSVRNRSVLGCNLACEFLIGRIGRDGMVERLMEIQ